MAERHFDERGHPRLAEIVDEIDLFFDTQCGKDNFWLRADDAKADHTYLGKPFQSDYLSIEAIRTIAKPQFLQRSGPVKLTGIYAVGSQAAHLPDAYLAGDHDLDLIIHTDMESSVPSLTDRILLTDFLRHTLNDGNGRRDPVTGKRYTIDVISNATRTNVALEGPSVQLYPPGPETPARYGAKA